jgi:hypothetical protein
VTVSVPPDVRAREVAAGEELRVRPLGGLPVLPGVQVTNVDRALLLAEWSVLVHPRDSEVLEACPVCFHLEPRPTRAHEPGCAMDLALSERGYCTQQERDRAREFIARGTIATAPTLPPVPPEEP